MQPTALDTAVAQIAATLIAANPHTTLTDATQQAYALLALARKHQPPHPR